MSYTIVGKRTLKSVLEHQARVIPENKFLIFEDLHERSQSWTYGKFDKTVNQIAMGLGSLGVKQGERVNVHLSNSPEFLLFWFAIAKLGAVMVPTNPLSPPDELCHPVSHSEAVLSVTQPNLLGNIQSIRPDCPHLKHVVVCGDSSDTEIITLDELVDGQPDIPPDVRIAPLDDAAILYTSGTTSKPKGVQVTHANYIFLSEIVSHTTGLTPGDRHFITMPLFHGNAQYYSVMTTINVGASLAVMARFSASRFIKQAGRHGCTIASMMGTTMRMVLGQPPRTTDRSHKLRLVFFAMSITQDQLEEWEDRFGIPLLQLYGMTETMGQPLANSLHFKRDNMGIGFPTSAYEIRVVDEDGNDVPEGTPGHLIVRGIPGITIMKGYFKDSERTAEAIRDGWLWTGDSVRVREDGSFRFVDRARDLIKRSGENVSAGEVEAVIKQHEAVSDVAVIGVPDALRDETIIAFVILERDSIVQTDEIIEFCKARMSKSRVPEVVEIRQNLPMTATSKVQKHILKKEFLEGKVT